MSILDLFSGAQRAPAECVVEIDQQEIVDLYPALVEVSVDADRKQWTTARLVFETRRLEDGAWVVQDDERIKPWKPIKILAVFGAETEEVMRGYIREVKAEYPSEKGAAKVTVTCQDESLKLDRKHVDQRWGEDAPTTDGAIATAIAQRHQLRLLAPPDQGQTVQDISQNTTDVRFLKRRADANGFETIFREGALYFGGMRLEGEPQSTILVYAGSATNCINFEIDDDGHQPDRVAYQVAAETGTDSPVQEVQPNLPLLGNEAVGSEAAGLDSFVWRPQRHGVSDDTQMSAIAQQAANDASMKIKVNGELDGALYGHVLRTGEPVGVDGLGERYSGIYYVDAVTHRFDSSGYIANFKLLRNAYGDNLSAASHPLAGVV